MDTITQALLGAACAQAVARKKLIKKKRIWLLGAFAGTLPDLDVLIHFPNDPIMTIYFHRHFTHALILIPILALVALLPFWKWLKEKEIRKDLYLCALAGVGTHALLDLTTTYGTLLLWPFSYHRFSLDWMPIIDPIYTLPLLIGIVLAQRSHSPTPARWALIFSTIYIFAGGHQHNQGRLMQQNLAKSRGHEIERGRVVPTMANLFWWRSVYESGGTLYTDGLLTTPWGKTRIEEGESLPLLNEEEFLSSLNPHTKERYQIFKWFADSYLARIPGRPDWIGDMRYSLEATKFKPIWGIRFSQGYTDIDYKSFRGGEGEERPSLDLLYKGYQKAFQ